MNDPGKPVPVVAFLGPAGTYSHTAAMQMFPSGATWLPVADISEVFEAVAAGRADKGVVPVENSSEGSVVATLDCFVQSPLTICGETLLRINQCLLATPRTRESGITRIISHQQSLGQCRQWLRSHYPDIVQQPVSSNAEAARLAADSVGVAAIAGKTAAQLYGLDILAESIEDMHDNTTRFLCVGAGQAARPTGRDRTSLIIMTQNEPGTLFRALEPFHRHGISLTKLESRPTRKSAWSYLFYVDLEGHAEDADVSAALRDLANLSIETRLLGSYPAAVEQA